jgi:hypothetical protein
MRRLSPTLDGLEVGTALVPKTTGADRLRPARSGRCSRRRLQAAQILVDRSDVSVADFGRREAVHHRASAGPNNSQQFLGSSSERHERWREPPLSRVAVACGARPFVDGLAALSGETAP